MLIVNTNRPWNERALMSTELKSLQQSETVLGQTPRVDNRVEHEVHEFNRQVVMQEKL